MRLTRIALRDFKGHASLDIEPADGLTVIRGPNEAGKSTLQQAIGFALFRKADGSARDMLGAQRWGASSRPRVQLDFTPRYAEQLDGLYQDWLKANRKPAEVARLREQAGVKPGEPVPRLRRGDFSIAPTERFQAEAEFLTDVEKKYFRDFGDFLKKELGVKALVIGNADHTYWIPGQPLLRSNSVLDFTDGHVYWQHPAIWGRRNTPMVDEPLRSTVLKLSRAALAGRAYTVSEVNHPNPNEYGAEMIPILAAYAALQDWDGIYFYTFETKIPGEYQPYVADEFDITLDPVKMSQMPVGALIFSRADVSAAKKLVSRTYSAEQVNETMRLPEAERPFRPRVEHLDLHVRARKRDVDVVRRIEAVDREPPAGREHSLLAFSPRQLP